LARSLTRTARCLILSYKIAFLTSAKEWIRFAVPHALRSTGQVSGHDLTEAPNKPDFGLLGWLERFTRDDPERAEGESRAAESCRKRTKEIVFLAPQARGPRRALRVAGWRFARNGVERAKNIGRHGICFPPFGNTAKYRAEALYYNIRATASSVSLYCAGISSTCADMAA
jgi:hypothetical protein